MRSFARYLSPLTEPFLVDGRVSHALVAVFVAIHVILLVNCVIHWPEIGWDAGGHHRYARELSYGRLPTPEVTHEFFCPPLPYLAPAAIAAAARAVGLSPGLAMGGAVKAAQLLNVAWSMLLCVYLLKLGRLIQPERVHVRLLSLCLLGMLPVYYMLFTWVRGEVPLAALMVVAVYHAVVMLSRHDFSFRRAAWLGLAMGLMGMSRQWAIPTYFGFGVAALCGLIHFAPRRKELLIAGAIAAGVMVPVGSFHYFMLKARYGSFTAFNQESQGLDAEKLPPGYFTDLKLDKLFTHPVRPAIGNLLWPLVYTGVWGDYWGNWVFWAGNTETGEYLDGSQVDKHTDPVTGALPAWLETNRDRVAPYLGRVNLVSLLPTAVGIAASISALAWATPFIVRGDRSPRAVAAALIVAAIVFSAAGFLAFVVQHPNPKGNTIKTGYQLHLFAPLALLAAVFLDDLRRRSPLVFRVIAVGLVLVFLHNLPVLFTRFWITPEAIKSM